MLPRGNRSYPETANAQSLAAKRRTLAARDSLTAHDSLMSLARWLASKFSNRSFCSSAVITWTTASVLFPGASAVLSSSAAFEAHVPIREILRQRCSSNGDATTVH